MGEGLIPASLRARLASLDFDGMAANFRGLLPVGGIDDEGHRRALKEIDASLSREPSEPRLHALKGKLLSNLSRFDEAREALGSALRLDGSLGEAHAWLGGTFLLERRPDLALPALERALRLDRRCAWAHFYRGASRYLLGERVKAAGDLRRALRTGGSADAGQAAAALLSWIESEQGKKPLALRRLDRLASARPRQGWPLLLRAHLQAGMGRPRQALRDLLAGLDRSAAEPGSQEALLAFAWEFSRELLMGGRRADYIALLGKVLEARPGWLKPRLNLARALMQEGSFDAAWAALAAVPREAAREPEVLFVRGQWMEARGRLAEAQALYRSSGLAGRDADAALAVALNLVRQDKTAEMFRVLARVLRRLPPPAAGDIDGELKRFRLCVCACDYESAFAIGQRVAAVSRELRHVEILRWPSFDSEFDVTFGSRAYHETALRRLDAFVAGHPRDPWGYYYRSILARSFSQRWGSPAGSAPRIEADLESVAALASAPLGWMRMETAKHRLYEGDLARALEDFRLAAAASVPSNWMAECQAAEVMLCRGDQAGALKTVDAALASCPALDRGCVLTWKGELLLWMGRYEEALRCLDEASGLAGQYVHCWRGGALVKLGRFKEALEPLGRAVSLSPHDVEARVWRGEALLRLGRDAEASASIEEALRAGGSANFYCFALRALLRARSGDLGGARDDLARLPDGALAFAARGLPGSPRPPYPDRAVAPVLEALLDKSRGVRRSGYEHRAWLR